MFAIESIDTFLVDLPTIRPHVLSMATMMRQTAVFVRIRCTDGIVGTGEATTIGGLSYGPESPEGIKLAIDTYFKPLLLKGDASRPALVMDMLGKSIVGNHFAKCAVETALLDAMGQRLGVPISELLGGRRRDSLPVAWTLPRKRQHRARYRGGRAHAGHPSPQYLQAQDRETQHRRGCRPCRRDQESRRRPRECAGRRQPGLG
jgi:L-alanine-DL-glutamate epimerase-like enolase superfamily enzyme